MTAEFHPEAKTGRSVLSMVLGIGHLHRDRDTGSLGGPHEERLGGAAVRSGLADGKSVLDSFGRYRRVF